MEWGLALLLPLSVLAVWMPALRHLVLGADALLVLLFVADFWATPRPDALSITRRLPERVGLSQPFTRNLHVEPDAAGRARGLELEVFEQVSEALELDRGASRFSARIPAAGILELPATYRGTRRGRSWLGQLRLRLTGPLGLVRRQARLAGRSTLRIQPALLQLSNTLALAASERWRDLGVRRLRRRGGLTEFESLREYVPGDDVRMVDWKATARRGRPIVRELQEERGQELILMVDCGRRMAAPGTAGDHSGWTKLDHALDAALQIAAVALQEGDRVGILAFDARVLTFVPPARGRGQFARLERAVFDRLPARVESDIEGALREVAVRHRRRAMLILISDVADPLSVEMQGRALAAGARHHRILFASLDDPDLRLVAEGEVAAEPRMRAAARALDLDRRQSLARLRRYGAQVVDALPAEGAGPVLAAWLDARRSGRA
jgi:uncharacterized protein (DUF58 family)